MRSTSNLDYLKDECKVWFENLIAIIATEPCVPKIYNFLVCLGINVMCCIKLAHRCNSFRELSIEKISCIQIVCICPKILH